MSLQKTPLDVPLVGGVDNTADPRLTTNPRTLQNGEYLKNGAITKRAGFGRKTLATNTVVYNNATGPATGVALSSNVSAVGYTTASNTPFVLSKNHVFLAPVGNNTDSNTTALSDIGVNPEIDIRETSIGSSPRSFYCWDMTAVSGFSYLAYVVWVEGVSISNGASIYHTVVDLRSGTCLYAPRVLVTLATTVPAYGIVRVTSQGFIVYQDNGAATLLYRRINTFGTVIATGTVPLSGAIADTTFDLCEVSTFTYIAYCRSFGTDVVVDRFVSGTIAFSATVTVVDAAVTNIYNITLVPDEAGVSWYVLYATGAGALGASGVITFRASRYQTVTTAMTQSFAPMTIRTTGATIAHCTLLSGAIFPGTTLCRFVTGASAYAAGTAYNSEIVTGTLSSAGALVTHVVDLCGDLSYTSYCRPFSFTTEETTNINMYDMLCASLMSASAVGGYAGGMTPWVSSFVTQMRYDSTGASTAYTTVPNGGWEPVLNLGYNTRSASGVLYRLDSTTWPTIPMATPCKTISYNGSVYALAPAGVVITNTNITGGVMNLCEISKRSIPQYEYTPTISAVVINSGTVIDENGASVLGFLIPPSLRAVATAGGAVAAGTYQVRAVYEYVMNNGTVIESMPSASVSVTTAGLNLNVTVTIAAPLFAASYAAKLKRSRVKIFMSTASGGTSLRLASSVPLDGVLVTGLAPLTAVISVIPALTEPLLYTLGGELDNVPPPYGAASCLHQQRVFVASADGNIYYSKPTTPNFSQELYIPKFVDDPVTALGSTGNALIIFTANSIWAIYGTGPADNGVGGQYSDPVNVTTVSGTTNPRGVIETLDGGIWFQNTRGVLCILSESLQITEPGRAVEDTTVGFAVTCGITDFQKECTYFGLCPTSGLGNCPNLVVYNYRVGSWSTHTIQDTAFTGGVVGAAYVDLEGVTVSSEAQSGTRVTLWRRGGTTAVAYGTQYARLENITYDASDSVNGYFNLRYLSPWMKPTGILGYARAYRVMMNIGTKTGAVNPVPFTINVYTDYGATPQAASYASGVISPTNIYFTPEVHVQNQKAEAFSVEYVESMTAAQQGADPIVLYGIRMIVGAKQGLQKTPATYKR